MIDPSKFTIGYATAEEVPACESCGTMNEPILGKKGVSADRWIQGACNVCRVRIAPKPVDELTTIRAARAHAARIGEVNPIPDRFAEASLVSTFVDDDNRKAHNASHAFVAAMIACPSGKGVDGFGLYGGKGAGKTHHTYAVVNDLRAAGVPALIFKFTAIEKAIRGTFGNDTAQKELEAMLVGAPLLVIDDLGKEPDNIEGKWAASVFADIVDDRWLAKLPMIVSSNFSPTELDERYRGHDRFEAIMDRLHDIFKLRWFAMKGATRRG